MIPLFHGVSKNFTKKIIIIIITKYNSNYNDNNDKKLDK